MLLLNCFFNNGGLDNGRLFVLNNRGWLSFDDLILDDINHYLRLLDDDYVNFFSLVVFNLDDDSVVFLLLGEGSLILRLNHRDFRMVREDLIFDDFNNVLDFW